MSLCCRGFRVLRVTHRCMSSFSVFTLACASVSWFIYLLHCSPISCIFLVDNVDGCQASVSWFLRLVFGMEDQLGPRCLLFVQGRVLPSELGVRSDFVAYGVIPSARAAVGNSGNAGTVILTRTFLTVCSGVPGPLVSWCDLASRQNLRVLAPAL